MRAVSDLTDRQRIAEQFKDAAEVQIEALVALKDRQKLTALANRLDPHTVEYNKARLALSNSVSMALKIWPYAKIQFLPKCYNFRIFFKNTVGCLKCLNMI